MAVSVVYCNVEMNSDDLIKNTHPKTRQMFYAIQT